MMSRGGLEPKISAFFRESSSLIMDPDEAGGA